MEDSIQTLANADIFFFVTTIAVILLTIMWTVFMVYIIKFVRDVRRIANEIGREAEEIIADVEVMRSEVKSKAGRITGLLGLATTARFIRRFFKD